MGSSPLAFTGVSQYSDDLQTILSRSVQIAQLPIKKLQSDQAGILTRKQLLSGLDTVVDALGSSVAALGSLGANKGLLATSSDAAKVTVTNTGAKQPTYYTISDITSIASAANETSLTGYADTDKTAVSSNGHLQLIFGTGTPIAITLGDGKNNLAGLRDAINALNAGVTATILTTGTGANPNLLAVSANKAGQTTLKLQDLPDAPAPAADLLTNTHQGSNTVFKLNGADVVKTTTSINDVIPGLSFNILGTTDQNANPPEEITLSLTSDRTPLRSALADFATKYNGVVDQVNAQVGPSAGLLNGDFVIRQLQEDLHQLMSYQGSGNIKSMASLGISLDKTGHMSFDATVFNGLSDAQIQDAYAFLGSPSSGLGALSQNFTQIGDPISGLIHSEQSGLDKADQHITDQINALNDRVAIMQHALTEKLQRADSMLADLQSQKNILTASVQSVNYVLYGKNTGNQ